MLHRSGSSLQHSGIALVLVLWVIVILTVMAASFSLNMRREVDLVRNSKERAVVGPVAEAGIYYAMSRLLESDIETQWRDDGTIYQFLFAGARVRVSILAEGGKFDLNYAPDAILVRLIENIGLSYDEAAQVVDAIIDWRDSDDFKRLNGAEKAEYLDEGRSYGPRNHAFQTLSELQLVLGVSGEIFKKLQPLLTVYSGSKGIDPTKSSRDVLHALPDITEDVVDIYLEDRAESAANSLPAPQFPVQVEGLELGNGENTTFSVLSEARFRDGQTAVIEAVIKKSNDGDTPFVFLDWKRKYPGENSLFREGIAVIGSEGEPI